MNSREFAQRLGGEINGLDTVLCPGPGHSPKDRSLAVRLNPNAPDGFLTFSHSGDDWRACRDHVRRLLGLPDWQPGEDDRQPTIPSSRIAQWDLAAIDAEVEQGPRPRSEDDLLRIARARAIWNEASDPRGTLAERYLRERRRLDLPDDLAGSVLRFHARCPWRDENTGKTIRVPALIAPFRSIDDDAVTGVQRVRLNPDGSKHGRRMLGIVHRAAIKLDAAGEMLHVGEGLETCMAGRQLGLAPAWALGSVGAISFFPVIDGMKTIVIFGEAGEASKNAIKVCGRRWRRAGRRVRAVMPTIGNDLNDCLIAEKAS